MCELPHRTLKNENGIGKVRDNRVGVQPTTHGELFICAKDLFVEATASPQTWNRRQDAACLRKRLLAKAENEGTAPFPKLAQWRAR